MKLNCCRHFANVDPVCRETVTPAGSTATQSVPMGIPPAETDALADWMRAAEALRDFIAQPAPAHPEDAEQTRHLIAEVLRAENRLRAVLGYPPRMFKAASTD